jgi:hypothetical protein
MDSRGRQTDGRRKEQESRFKGKVVGNARDNLLWWTNRTSFYEKVPRSRQFALLIRAL